MRWVGPGLIVLGIALVVAAVATGGAQLELIVVVPVFVGGASALFLGGVVSIFVGIFLLPLAFGSEEAEPSENSPAEPGPTSPRSGGLVLIGPVPIFFGGWKNPGRRAYWVAVLVGAGLVVVAIALAFGLR